MIREMVLPEDEMRIFNVPLETRLKDTDQQLQKWVVRWKPVLSYGREYFDIKLMSKVIMSYLSYCLLIWAIPFTTVYSMGVYNIAHQVNEL